MLSNANSDLPWEQQALHLVIETVQEALHDKSPAEQQSLQAALMTLRGFLAASRLTHEEGGTSWEPFLEPIAPSDMSRSWISRRSPCPGKRAHPTRTWRSTAGWRRGLTR